MKSVVKLREAGFVPFPKLMYNPNKNIVVLFSNPQQGTVINAGNSNYDTGDYREDWITNNFVDFSGEVTLSN